MANELLGDYETHVAEINDVLAQAGIDRSELVELDHLAWRTETDEQFEEDAAALSSLGERLLPDAKVEDRFIAAIALREHIVTGGWNISTLEVAAPKDTSPYPRGLEHAEFVVSGPLKDFAARHANLNFKMDAMGRIINPELKLKQFPITLKFHQLSLVSAFAIEQALLAKGIDVSKL
jgi:predicted metalloenzyme YecM